MASLIEGNGAFVRWQRAVDAFKSEPGPPDYSILGTLRPAAAEIGLLSAFGRWCVAVSNVIDSRGGLSPVSTANLSGLLRAAGGEMPLQSAVGQWAKGVVVALSQTRA